MNVLPKIPLGALDVPGLTQAEAAAKLETEGYNELHLVDERRIFRLLFDLLREPMVYLLLGCGAVYLVLGDTQEAVMLLGFLGVILGITLYQERKAERALRALRELSSPRALVLRNGVRERISGREVVRGDILLLAEGARVPADGDVLSSLNLDVDESLLTGEAVAVSKIASRDRVFAGTTVVRGTGMVKVTDIGSQTEIGKIGGIMKASSAEPTRLELETRRLVRIIALVAASLCVAVVGAYASYQHSLTQGVLAGLTLAMAILPNELPAVLTIFMALGAWRLSRQRVLTRRIAAIEALGTTTVLCVDKTGTLTMNRLSLRKLVVDDESYDMLEHGNEPLPENFHLILEFGLLAVEQEAIDPIDRAFREAGDRHLADTEHLHPDWAVVHQYPLTPELLAISQVWRPASGQALPVGAKGAPEAIIDLCHLPDAARDRILGQVRTHACQGFRMLAVARGFVPQGSVPAHHHDVRFEFLGLVGLEDPLRSTVPAAVAECQAAGIRVIMITGDHPETACSIARQAGLPRPEEVLTGRELESLTPDALAERLRTVSVCARMVPQQKGRLVEALKAQGEVVAMTGDGVNDAPALKLAHIGIAMGQRGTDVAREAADIVLLDDDFGSIVEAVRMGRRIYDNLRDAMSYLLAVHVPIAGMSIIPVFFNMPLVLMPIHIAFLHLIIEPACSVAFEAAPTAGDVMRRPPRPKAQRLFSRSVLVPTIVQGLSVLIILLAVFVVAWRWGRGESDARALAFAVLIVANAGLIIASLAGGRKEGLQGQRANKALRWVVLGSLGLSALVLYTPQLRQLFHFALLHPVDLLLCLIAGLSSSLWFLFLRGRDRSIV